MKTNKRIRIFSLLLAVVLLSSAMGVTAFADSTFTDSAKIGSAYTAAVNYMAQNKVLEGFKEDGSFRPEDTLTREQAAKIVAFMVLGEKAGELTAKQPRFKDVDTSRWSAASIDFCVANEIVSGYGDSTFGPEDKLSGTQFAKMLLCAFGYGKATDYVGSSWVSAVKADGKAIDLFEGDKTMVDAAALSRQQAALMAYNIIKAGGANGFDKTIDIGSVSLAFGKNTSDYYTQRFFRNADEEIFFHLDLDHNVYKENGYITVKLRVYPYNSNNVICSYIFSADVTAGKRDTYAEYSGSLEDLMAFDRQTSDYFNDVNTYKVDVIVNSTVLRTFTLTTAYDSKDANRFIHSINPKSRSWASPNSGDYIAPEERIYNDRYIGMVRTLGFEFDLASEKSFDGELPIVCKWYYDGQLIQERKAVADFTNTHVIVDTTYSDDSYRTLDYGTYTCVCYVLGIAVDSVECKIVK